MGEHPRENQSLVAARSSMRVKGGCYQFYDHKGVFADYLMLEYDFPRNLKEGTREHVLYLTYVSSIDYMTDARASKKVQVIK